MNEQNHYRTLVRVTFGCFVTSMVAILISLLLLLNLVRLDAGLIGVYYIVGLLLVASIVSFFLSDYVDSQRRE